MCLLPLLGMGLTRVSMSPAFVPTVKEMIRVLTIKEARCAARRVANVDRQRSAGLLVGTSPKSLSQCRETGNDVNHHLVFSVQCSVKGIDCGDFFAADAGRLWLMVGLLLLIKFEAHPPLIA